MFFVTSLPSLAGTARGCALCRTDSIFYDASRRSKDSWEIKTGVFCYKSDSTSSNLLVLFASGDDKPRNNGMRMRGFVEMFLRRYAVEIITLCMLREIRTAECAREITRFALVGFGQASLLNPQNSFTSVVEKPTKLPSTPNRTLF